VTMDITPHESAKYMYYSQQIRFLNLSGGLEVSEAGPLEVTVSGAQTDLAALTTEDIVVSVDLSECRRAGTYTMPVTVTVPENIRALEGLELTVTLSRTEGN
jgi:YbbR domain-containing protein